MISENPRTCYLLQVRHWATSEGAITMLILLIPGCLDFNSFTISLDRLASDFVSFQINARSRHARRLPARLVSL
jgi:hypothetical protein